MWIVLILALIFLVAVIGMTFENAFSAVVLTVILLIVFGVGLRIWMFVRGMQTGMAERRARKEWERRQRRPGPW